MPSISVSWSGDQSCNCCNCCAPGRVSAVFGATGSGCWSCAGSYDTSYVRTISVGAIDLDYGDSVVIGSSAWTQYGSDNGACEGDPIGSGSNDMTMSASCSQSDPGEIYIEVSPVYIGITFKYTFDCNTLELKGIEIIGDTLPCYPTGVLSVSLSE